jgi:hypothetical protein
MLKRILIVIVIILVIIQFIRPTKNVHPGTQPNSIMNKYPASAEVKGILEKTCYDCHSNNTRYPWYNNIQPVAWWLNNHIKDGKRSLNFDEFLTYPANRQAKKMKQVIDEVKEGEMPLSSYTIIHKDAKLTDPEKQALLGWASGVQNSYGLPTEKPADKREED